MNRYLLPIAMLLLGGCLGAAAVGVPAVAQEKAAKRMDQWEYKVVQVDFYREGEAERRMRPRQPCPVNSHALSHRPARESLP